VSENFFDFQIILISQIMLILNIKIT